MAQDWDIKPRGTICADCEKMFEHNEAYFSALTYGEEGYQRHDFCTGCWVGKEAELQPFSSWKGTFIIPPEVKDEEPLKKENAESLLRRLIEDDNTENAPVIYILAVMLERKKILVEKDVNIEEDGTVHRVYEHKKSGETFLILDPQLKLDRLQDVQERVVELLGGKSDDKDSNSGNEDSKQDDPSEVTETQAAESENSDADEAQADVADSELAESGNGVDNESDSAGYSAKG
jgi:hypothetical protein